MGKDQGLIPKHGGYRQLKSYQLAELIYDVTVRFCDSFIDRRSRTHDQMVQAARSGTRNIAEGSAASATSKKTELKLTGVARASLEELKLDYIAFLRQRGLSPWPANHPALRRFKARRCSTLEEIRAWVRDERAGVTVQSSVSVRDRPCSSVSSAEIVANAVLSVLNIDCALLDRQLSAQARAFEHEGGFTERLYRVRTEKRWNILNGSGLPGES